MTDSIRLIITRGVNEDGTGGTVVDDASVILQSLPNGVPMLDATIAAFADAYPIPTVKDKDGNEKPTYSPERHISACFRKYANEVADGYRSKLAQQAAAGEASKAKEASDKAQKIVVSVGDPVSNPEVLE